MAKLNVDRSIVINAPVDKVYQVVSDFHQWRPWSPWLIQEPSAEVTVREDGKYYEWVGDRTGEGKMSVIDEEPNQSVDYDLEFLKPWKSKAKVRFETKPEGSGTKVTWFMDSSLPFFLFWMKKMMTNMLNSDYDRGLNMLKEYVENGDVKSNLDFQGTSQFEGCTYVGVTTNCAIADIGPKMGADFKKLETYFADKKDSIAGPPVSIYHKWDIKNGNAQYTAALPVKSLPANVPSGMVSGAIPATQVYTLQHKGSYHHLGNAWATMMGMVQTKQIKQNRKIHPFEVYLNDPAKVAPEELLTEVKFAVK